MMIGNFGLYKRRSFGIDLGNNNTLVNDEAGTLSSRPSYITFNTNNRTVKAIGEQAYNMYEKTHDDLTSIKPLKRGVIADFESARQMIREIIKGVYSQRSFFAAYDNIISGVPYYTTAVEQRALREALDQFNARHTYLLYEPMAAAIGMGLNIQEPEGKLVIDIGGGITEIAVISLSGVAAFQSINVAGDAFDLEIQDYFRRRYNMAIGIKTAEHVKMRAGTVTIGKQVSPFVSVKGKDIISGLPVTQMVSHEEMAEVLDKPFQAIEQAIIHTLETCPPELAADIYQSGLMVTGGGARLRGVKERLETTIQLPVHIDVHALTSVSRGLSKVLGNLKTYKGVLVS